MALGRRATRGRRARIGFSSEERRAAITLASIFALRMLGLFMIYPIFAIAARRYSGATAASIGLALGIYGLTQAGLQIPFGIASDRFGRKPLITFGLILFVVGSIIAALVHSVDGLILGRAVQGGGAVGAVILALTADLTRAEQRTKAIGIIGMSIGLSFALALVVGPLINGWVGLRGLFWLTAVLGVLAIVVLWVLVPTPGHIQHHRDAQTTPKLMMALIRDPQLLRLNASIFMQHAILAALFLAVPMLLKAEMGTGVNLGWMFYLPVLGVAFVLMVPFIIYAETRQHMKGTLLGAVGAILLSLAALRRAPAEVWISGIILTVFFTAFTLLEGLLPSLVSKVAPIAAKGTAMGIYSTSQFFGIFVGAALGGWIDHAAGGRAVILFVLALAVVWWLILLGLRRPPHYSTRVAAVPEPADPSRLAHELRQLPGVIEAVVVTGESSVYLKLDREKLDEAQLGEVLSPTSGAG